MLVLLTAEQITKSYTEKPLLRGVSFSLDQGDKLGVVGVNGTGKSTLLKIVAGEEAADSGQVVRGGKVRISYLPQNPQFRPGNTILEQVLEGLSPSVQEAKEYEAKAILTRLGIQDFSAAVGPLSGGQRKKVAMASALIRPCEVLILDEPTNHLDSEMVSWLEEYLQSYRGALLMVTHDRYFLDRVTNGILELDRGQLYRYQANYSKFLELKAEREEREAGTQRKRRSFLRRELEWVKQGPKARGTKSRFRLERYEEMSRETGPLPQERLELSSVASRLGRKTILLDRVSKSYGEQVLISDFSCVLARDSRIGVVGRNGCGKSTLLKLILGTVAPDSGTVTLGETVKIGYFSQEGQEMDPSQRAIDFIRDQAERIQTPQGVLTASQLLEQFLFPPDLQWNTISRLSGGEKRRLALCRVLMGAPNVLLLDEPTNDLDIQTLAILEEYLEQFQGAVVAVSHDRYFLDKVADHLWAFQGDGQIKTYLGGYTAYLEQRQEEAPQEGKRKQPRERKKPSQQKRRFSFRDKYDYQHIEAEIAQLEEQQRELEAELEREASNYARLEELMDQKEELDRLLEEKTQRWVDLSELAQELGEDL